MDSLEFDAALDPAGLRFAIVVSRFNESITDRLLAGAQQGLEGAAELRVVRVPGAWELPLAARDLADSGLYDAVVCLGCVIRGGTPHFDYVAGECARGLQMAQLETGVPIVFGVLTTDNVAQAEERLGKGRDAALTAIEMAMVMKAIHA